MPTRLTQSWKHLWPAGGKKVADRHSHVAAQVAARRSVLRLVQFEFGADQLQISYKNSSNVVGRMPDVALTGPFSIAR